MERFDLHVITWNLTSTCPPGGQSVCTDRAPGVTCVPTRMDCLLFMMVLVLSVFDGGGGGVLRSPSSEYFVFVRTKSLVPKLDCHNGMQSNFPNRQ